MKYDTKYKQWPSSSLIGYRILDTNTKQLQLKWTAWDLSLLYNANRTDKTLNIHLGNNELF